MHFKASRENTLIKLFFFIFSRLHIYVAFYFISLGIGLLIDLLPADVFIIISAAASLFVCNIMLVIDSETL